MADYETHIRDGAIHSKIYNLKLKMAVDNFVFRIIMEHFNVHINVCVFVQYHQMAIPA